MKKCPRCENIFDDSDDFCPNDGVSLVSLSGDSPTVVVNRPFVTPTSNPIASPSNRWVFPLIGILCGLVVVFGFFALYGSGRSDNTSNASSTTPTPSVTNTAATPITNAQPLMNSAPPVARMPPGGSRYRGNIGGADATFNLSWRNNQVNGNYVLDRSPGEIYTLSGTNQIDGYANATAQLNDQVAGTMRLEKSTGSSSICWSGTFYPTSGGTSSVNFCRTR